MIREGDGSVWVADRIDLTVTEIDLESRRVMRTIGVGFRPDDMAARNGALWAFDKEERVLARLGDEQTWDRFEHADFAGVERIEVEDHAIWLAGGRRLIRVDPASGRVVRTLPVPVRIDGLATVSGDVWAVSRADRAVLRLDPRTAEIRDRISVAGSSNSLAIMADADFLWVLDGETATVTRIDPGLHEIAETYRLSVGRGQLALAAGEGAAWVSNALDGTVTRIDGATNAVSSIPVSVYSSPRDVTVAGGLVWVTVADDRAPQ